MKLSKTLILLSVFLPCMASAQIDYDFLIGVEPLTIRPVASVFGGVAFISKIDASNSFAIDDETFDYVPNKESETRGVYGGFIGIDWNFDEDWWLQSGLAYYQFSPFFPTGVLNQDDGGGTESFTYEYQVISSQVLWENKLLLEWSEGIYPYVSVGIGVSSSDTKKYQTSAESLGVDTVDYDHNSNNSFGYNVGLGIDVDIFKNFRVGIGYRFASLGKIGLGNVTFDDEEISNADKLQQDHLYAQEIIAQFTLLM